MLKLERNPASVIFQAALVALAVGMLVFTCDLCKYSLKINETINVELKISSSTEIPFPEHIHIVSHTNLS